MYHIYVNEEQYNELKPYLQKRNILVIQNKSIDEEWEERMD